MPRTSTSEPLTGKALQDVVKKMQGTEKKEIAKACGYVTTGKNGRERVNLMAFYQAMLEAEGVAFEAKASGGRRGRGASYRARVHKNGTLLIGAAYTKEMGLEPGDEFTLKLGKRSLSLTRVDAEAAKE
ncbi:MAG: AbrB family transcriptional regulator [Cyanobacteria bacterium J06649_11]